MSEEEKKTIEEEKTILNPEGYTIVKYAEGGVDFIVLVLSLVVLTFILCAFKDVFMDRIWLFFLVDFGVLALLWVIGRKITLLHFRMTFWELPPNMMCVVPSLDS